MRRITTAVILCALAGAATASVDDDLTSAVKRGRLVLRDAQATTETIQNALKPLDAAIKAKRDEETRKLDDAARLFKRLILKFEVEQDKDGL